MPERDLEAIGAHCQYEYCHQLDFLPFRCESCKGTFCLDHRTETTHSCPKAGEWATARRRQEQQKTSVSNANGNASKPTLQTATQCSHPQCKTYVNTHTSVGVSCTNCNRTYCLKHRLREEHGCANLAPIGARPASSGPTQAEKAKAALGRLRAWGKEKQAAAAANMSNMPKTLNRTGTGSSATVRGGNSSVAAVNALKRTAKGDVKVPPEKRVYLHVEAEAGGGSSNANAKIPRGEFYYSGDWPVGRLLDAAAKALQVENVNNRRDGEEERLRVFHVEAGRVLGFAEKVGDVCASGTTVVLLRGVGPGS